MGLELVSLVCMLLIGLESQKDQILIQGQWRVLFGATPSKSRNYYITGWTIQVQGRRMVLREYTPEGQLIERPMFYVLDPIASPKKIDIMDGDGRAAQVMMRGIYEVSPNILVLWLYGKGAGDNRPKDFALPSEARLDYLVLVLFRVKEGTN